MREIMSMGTGKNFSCPFCFSTTVKIGTGKTTSKISENAGKMGKKSGCSPSGIFRKYTGTLGETALKTFFLCINA